MRVHSAYCSIPPQPISHNLIEKQQPRAEAEAATLHHRGGGRKKHDSDNAEAQGWLLYGTDASTHIHEEPPGSAAVRR